MQLLIQIILLHTPLTIHVSLMLSWVTPQNSKGAMKFAGWDLNFLIYFYYYEQTVLWLTENMILSLVRLLLLCEGQLCWKIDFCKSLLLELLLKNHAQISVTLSYSSAMIVNQGLWFLGGIFNEMLRYPFSAWHHLHFYWKSERK